MTWNGAGGWVIFSHDRHVNFSRTVWITFHCRGNHLQGLGDRLAELGQLAAAAWAGSRAGDHHTLAREMRRKRRAHRFAAGARGYRSAPSRFRGDFVLGRTRHRLLELQLQLAEQLAAAFGGLPVLLASSFAISCL